MAFGVPQAGKEEVLGPALNPGRLAFRQLGVIAADQIKRLAVLSRNHRVVAVLAAAGFARLHFGGIELVIPVGIGEAIKGASAAVKPKAVEGPGQAVSGGKRNRWFHAGKFDGDRFNQWGFGPAQGDAEQAFLSLIAGIETPLGIGRQRDPGAMFGLGDEEEAIDDKARRGEDVERDRADPGRCRRFLCRPARERAREGPRECP